MRDREFWIWDSRDLSKPLKTQTIDSAPGCLTPLYDTDTDILYMSARVRVFFFLSIFFLLRHQNTK
jgi:coronin-7